MKQFPFKLGDWLVICDRCKFKRYASQVTKTWDGLIVCKPEVKPGCFEHRHPQDFVRGVKDDQSVPFTRPRTQEQFVDFTFNCTAAEPVPIPKIHTVNRTVYKGYTNGLVIIESGVTVTVVCQWDIS